MSGVESNAQQSEDKPLLNGRYRLLRPLGQGGMGTVYLAEHVRLDTIVAVKEVHAEHSSEEEYQAGLAQCEREARTLVRLHHANLPNVTDAFIEEGRFYLVMEYIEGETLEAKLKDADGKPVESALVIEWALQIADVLAYLHTQEPPIIFRDLKPANVMVQPNGNIRLIDFGIARRFQPGASKDTALLGSVGYSPPEQFGRHQTDTRSDIYAFGATLHHLLTGLDPAASPFKFKPVVELNPQVPQALSELIAHCVMLDADARPQNIHSVAMRLLAIRDSGVVMLAEPTPASTPAETSGVLPPAETPTPPRIISAKLAEAEAQKRRTGSREVGMFLPGGSAPFPVPSARERSTSSSQTQSWRWLAVGTAVVLLSIAAVGIVRTRHAPQAAVSKELPPKISLPGNPNLSPPTRDTQPPPSVKRENRDTQPIPTTQLAEVRAQLIGITPDASGNLVLHIATTGSLPDEVFKEARVAAFFYDKDAQPVLSQDPHYMNPDGQASTATSITPNPADGAFQAQLDMPVTAFSPSALQGPLQFRCIVFIDLKQAGETDYQVLPYPLAPTSGAEGRNSSGNGGDGNHPQPPVSSGGIH